MRLHARSHTLGLGVPTDLFEGHPAAGRVGRVLWAAQALQGVVDGLAVRLLEPGLVRGLGRRCRNAAHMLQGKHHRTHEGRVLLAHDGNLLLSAETETETQTLYEIPITQQHPVNSGFSLKLTKSGSA